MGCRVRHVTASGCWSPRSRPGTSGWPQARGVWDGGGESEGLTGGSTGVTAVGGPGSGLCLWRARVSREVFMVLFLEMEV